MSRKSAALAVAFAALLAACAGRYGSNTASNGSSFALPNMPDLQFSAVYPDGKGTGTISEELPAEGLGQVMDPFWNAKLGGYTQQQFSQALGFPPGTKLTIKNISKSIHHTLDVVKKIKGPPANFPGNPTLSQMPSGGKLQKGYASGSINPGSSVTVTLGKAGIYLIGCAFHYHSGMQDVLVVGKNATPGPQATAPAQ
jgi:plastocyanin